MLGQAVNSKCRGFLVDGDYSIEWRKAPPTPSLERSVRRKALRASLDSSSIMYVLQGTLPFMSMRLLSAWVGDLPIVHTAVDDLESFLWVLVWALVHIFKKIAKTRNATIDVLAEWSSSYHFTNVMAREPIIQVGWKDVVFGGLLREWLNISLMARLAIERHVETVSGSGHDVDRRREAFDQLEEYCRSVYLEFIQTGHKHLENIRWYSDWDAVVEANPRWLK